MSDPEEPPAPDGDGGVDAIQSASTGGSAPGWIFALELAYLGTLTALAVLYHQSSGLRRLVPDPAGPIPVGVAWWGAVGGVTISLTGIFRHSRSWDSSLNMWHSARPVLGAVMGTVGYLIFVTVIRATGNEASNRPVGAPVFYLVAFLLGYREEVFREVLRKAVDVLLAPGRRP
ncbi:MAG: hypothetical protein M3083_23210 [Actinomycetota bacterium]|nr:hypothetical protein [Actinomycetota bacterium]MDQ6945885.1 hypothetical protein [Actinomycetota bacterium]